MSKTTDKLLAALKEFDGTAEGLFEDLKLDLTELVIRGLKQKGWSHGELSSETGISESTIDGIVMSSRNTSLRKIADILRALGMRAKLVEATADATPET